MARETIKSFVYKAYREGLDAETTWRATEARFPQKAISWGYVNRLRREIAQGDKVAEAFAGLMSEAQRRL